MQISRCNKVAISGKVASELEKSYSWGKEDFYSMQVDCVRQSGKVDKIYVIVPQLQLMGENISVGDYINIEGQFRSRQILADKEKKDSKKYNRLFVFASIVNKNEQKDETTNSKTTQEDLNDIEIKGKLIKKRKCRETPSGREIIDFMLKVERDYDRYDYIPCVAWGRKAKAIERIEIGTVMECVGRIQSKNHEKRIDEKTTEEFTTFELSCSDIVIETKAEEQKETEQRTE